VCRFIGSAYEIPIVVSSSDLSTTHTHTHTDPQDAVVARQYLKSKKQFEQKAAQWTQQYAKQANQSELDAKVRQLTVMGFEEQVRPLRPYRVSVSMCAFMYVFVLCMRVLIL
jgi:hypothetical protein